LTLIAVFRAARKFHFLAFLREKRLAQEQHHNQDPSANKTREQHESRARKTVIRTRLAEPNAGPPRAETRQPNTTATLISSQTMAFASSNRGRTGRSRSTRRAPQSAQLSRTIQPLVALQQFIYAPGAITQASANVVQTVWLKFMMYLATPWDCGELHCGQKDGQFSTSRAQDWPEVAVFRLFRGTNEFNQWPN